MEPLVVFDVLINYEDHDSKTFNPKTCQLIVVGASAGGLNALIVLVQQLPKDFPAPC